MNGNKRQPVRHGPANPSTRVRRRTSLAKALRYRPRLHELESRVLPSILGSAGERLPAAYGQIPLSFEANQGQADPAVEFLAHGQGYGIFLTAAETVLSLSRPAPAAAGTTASPAATVDASLRIHLVGGNAAPQMTGVDRLEGVSNYLLGNDPSQWHTNIPTYAKVAYHDVYPGIDLIYYGNQQQLEYDFNLAPGADPRAIRLAFDGAQGLSLDGAGDLVVQTAGGAVVEHAPVLYQMEPDGRHAVAGQYVLTEGAQVGFAVGAYDASLHLVIDPTLGYSTYLGGGRSDVGHGIAVDGSGNAYVTGQALSANFPIAGGAFQQYNMGGTDVFVTKLNPGGNALIYSTYLGGSGDDIGWAIAVDGSGNAYVTGQTSSANFPTTPGAFQPTPRGPRNAFVTKLNPGGNHLVYSTYLGGSIDDFALGIAVDGSGNAYVTGYTRSFNFPTTPWAFQPAYPGGASDAFVTKLNPDRNLPPYLQLVYSTFLGGSGEDGATGIAVDGSGNAYVIGDTSSTNFPTTTGAFRTTNNGGVDVFVTKLNPGGNGLVYSTYLGGSADDRGGAIAVDVCGHAYVTGYTYSVDFPTTPGAFQTTYQPGASDAFVAKLNASGTGLVYSTFLGGSGEDDGLGIAVDGSGSAYITGDTTSTNFPTTTGAFQQTNHGGYDAFVTKLNASGTGLVSSTYLGGSGNDIGYGIAVDRFGNAYVTGSTTSDTFPTTAGAFQTTKPSTTSFSSAFVTKLPCTIPGTFHFLISAPATSLAGTPFSIIVTVLDDANHVVTNYTGTVYFSSSDPQAVLPDVYTFTAADQGRHVFTVTLKTAGCQSIIATDRSTGITGQTIVHVGKREANHLGVTGFPSPTTAGVPSVFTVAALDPYGNTDTDYTGTVHFSSTDPQAILPPDYTFTAADLGTHVFSAVLSTAGTQAVTATDTATVSITGTQSGIVISPAAPAHFAVSAPASVTAGAAFPLTVIAQDCFGNPTPAYLGTVHFSSSDGQAGRPADATLTNGVGTFSVTLATAGDQTVTVTDTANSAITGSAAVQVVAAPAVAFQVLAPSTASSGQAFDVTVIAVDPFGNTDPGYAGTVTFSTSDPDPGVVLPAAYTFQPGDAGVVTFAQGVSLVTLGDQTLTATDPSGGLTGSATVTVTSPMGPGGRGSRAPNATAAEPTALERLFAAGAAERWEAWDWTRLAAAALSHRRRGSPPADAALVNDWAWDWGD